MAIRAGELRQRVKLQAPVETVLDTGEVEITYDTVATIWASVIPLSSSEVFRLDGVSGQDSFQIKLRYRPDISKRHRLIFNDPSRGDIVLHINSVVNVDNLCNELKIEATSIG